MGNVSFTAENVAADLSALNGNTSNFVSTLSSINTGLGAIGNLQSAIVITGLKKIGEELFQSVQDFKNNFNEWNQVVTLIAAAHNDFSVAANATYRDSLESSDSAGLDLKALGALGLADLSDAELLAKYNDYLGKGLRTQEKEDGIANYIRTETDSFGDTMVYVDVKDKNGKLLYTFTNDKYGKLKYFVPTEDGTMKQVDNEPLLTKSDEGEYVAISSSGGQIVTSSQDKPLEFSNMKNDETITLKDGTTIKRIDNEEGYEITYNDGNKTIRREFYNSKNEQTEYWEFSTENGNSIVEKYHSDGTMHQKIEHTPRTSGIDDGYERVTDFTESGYTVTTKYGTIGNGALDGGTVKKVYENGKLTSVEAKDKAGTFLNKDQIPIESVLGESE